MRALSLKIKIAFMLTTMTLTGCGRKELPTAPNPSEATYPRTYPMVDEGETE